MRRRRSIARRRKLQQLEALRPHTPDELHHFVRAMFGLNVPRRAIVDGNDAPFAYLEHTFFESDEPSGGDCVVWANRGGGKTQLGAAATLLDLMFKPGIEICILGGSFEQSSRMYEYLRYLAERPMLHRLMARQPTQRRLELINASRVDVLTQSQQNVRGRHVHKLRCDEVELFKPDVWQAAQMAVRSSQCGPVAVRGAVEAISTMHRPYGLMRRIVEAGAPAQVMRWCYLDVIERCPPARDCQTCRLWNDCRGRAKQADGFIRIDDLVDQHRRSSDETWDSEMMCRRPRRDTCVYPNFDIRRHVAPGERNPRTRDNVEPQATLIGGMDLGLRSPLVLLWAYLLDRGNDVFDHVVEVAGEYVQEGLTLEQHLQRIESRNWPQPVWIGVDPAGGQRSSQTGLSDIEVLRRHGYNVRTCISRLRPGIECVRRRLDRDTLRIDPSCHRLIEAMETYHFDTQRPQNEIPVKDGPDHACDALRYMLMNLENAGGRVEAGQYARV